MKTYHYIVKGRVQGVSFRYYTVHAARQYGISGTVQNVWNGDVEVYAQGDAAGLADFEKFLNRGPGAARVTEVVKNEIDSNHHFSGFSIIY